MALAMELDGPVTPAGASAPTLKRSWGFTGMSSNASNCGTGAQVCNGDDFILNLETVGPRKTAVGEILVLALKNPNANTATVTDNTPTTFTSGLTCNDGVEKYTLFYDFNVPASLTSVKIHFGASVSDIQFALYLFYNVATVSPLDGAGICTTGVVPTNNLAPNIASGSFTPGTSGDLILNQVFDAGHPVGMANPTTDSVYGSGFTGLYGEVNFGGWAQFIVQPTAAAINPAMTVVQATHDTFTSMSIAIKVGTGGTAPAAGISIIRSQTVYIQDVATTTVVPFSTPPGDLIVVGNDAGTAGSSLTGVSDSQGNTYTAVPCNAACVAAVPQHPQLFYAANAIPNNSNHMSLVTSTNSGTDLVMFYDLAGAAIAPVDTSATAANLSTLTATSSGATYNQATQGAAGATFTDEASITPSTSGEFMIDMGQVGNGPSSGCSGAGGSTSVGTYDYVPFTQGNSGSGDNNGLSNGDVACHYYDATTAVVNFGFTMANNVASSIESIAVAFKAAPAAAVVTQVGAFLTGP